MPKDERVVGSTSNIFEIFLQNSASTTGAGLTGLVFNSASLTAAYKRDTDSASVNMTLANVTTLGTFANNGFREVEATNMPGIYEFDPPNAAFNSGAKSVVFVIKGATNLAPCVLEIALKAVNTQSTTDFMASVPNVAGNVNGSVLGNLAGNVNGSVLGSVTGNIGGNVNGNVLGTVANVAGNVNGSVLGNLAGNVNGNVLGTVANVAGNVNGSVLGNLAGNVNGNVLGTVANVAGNVNGNVLGTVANVAGNVNGSILGNLAGNVNGNVLGTVANIAGNVNGSVLGNLAGNVNGSVLGSVTGNLGGNVNGSVLGSVTGNIGGNVNGNVLGSIGSLDTQAKADVNAEVLDVLNVDTFAQPGQATPAATTTIRLMLAWLYKAWRNRTTQTASEYDLYNDDAATVDQKATFSDDGTTADRGEISTGP